MRQICVKHWRNGDTVDKAMNNQYSYDQKRRKEKR